MRVLIVEDDESMSIALRDGFEYEGYSVTLARDGEAGLELARSERPDLILLDVMLPRRTGLDLCRELRGGGDGVPIIMLTARGQEIDKVLGLKTGADDYITKPFGFMELLARAEAVLRRSGRSDRGGAAAEPARPALATYRFADVSLDFKCHEACKAGRRLDLSPREFELMRFFIEHRGEVITRERLLDAVWDYNTIPLTRTVDMHIAKLRKKIEDNPADPCHIVTVHRLGYKFTG
jgi:two-component system alkaline phosphatase synthesis response regulator PhoP